MSARAENAFSLVDLLLAEQQDLTAVERFARYHDREPAARAPYRELLPLSPPKPGEQYSFVVDLDRCSGCKACVSACHSLNGLEENEMWRSVGLIVGESTSSTGAVAAYQQTITTACHHCVEPACAEGCPVLAYDKDPQTGIVRHLDDQCIGCQYCILKCPYDVPKFSASKGIVRKCDMCYGRLSAGEAPACAQACPHEAIRIEIVNQEVVRAAAQTGSTMVPGAFDSALTLPTTQYRSAKRVPYNAVSADAVNLRVEAAHWPLVLMLVATQLAVGLHLLNVVLQTTIVSLVGCSALFAGLGVSVLHLGRPLKAWRAFLGWKKSWMSREVIAFSFYGLAAVLALVIPAHKGVNAGLAALGLFAVFCSAMIYVDTCRSAWAARIVFPKFFGTLLLLGITGGAALAPWIEPAVAPILGGFGTIIRTLLFCWERTLLQDAVGDPLSPRHRSALIALRLRKSTVRARGILFVISTSFALLALANWQGSGAAFGVTAFASTLASQILDRYLFFVTANAPRMPGVPV